jgi:hypothetical protein
MCDDSLLNTVGRLERKRRALALMLRRALKRMRQYEKVADNNVPRDHRQFIEQGEELLMQQGFGIPDMRNMEVVRREAQVERMEECAMVYRRIGYDGEADQCEQEIRRLRAEINQLENIEAVLTR